MALGGNCQGPLVKIFSPVDGIQVRQRDGGVYGPWTDVTEDGTAFPADVGSLQVRLNNAKNVITQWEVNGVIHKEAVLNLKHSDTLVINAVTRPRQVSTDFTHPAAGLTQLLLTSEQDAKLKRWIDALP